MRPAGNIGLDGRRLALDDRREASGIEGIEWIDAEDGIGRGCN